MSSLCVSNPMSPPFFHFFFFFNDTATTEIYTLSLHDALPISLRRWDCIASRSARPLIAVLITLARSGSKASITRSEEHTSELQSRLHLVCRLLLEKKKKKQDSSQLKPTSIVRTHYRTIQHQSL